jgi:hypothetical protein
MYKYTCSSTTKAQHRSHSCRRYGLERTKFVRKPVCSNAQYRPFGCRRHEIYQRLCLVGMFTNEGIAYIRTKRGKTQYCWHRRRTTICCNPLSAQNDEIPRSSYTIAEPLRDNGYECAVMGKWHVYKYEVSAAFKQGGGNAYFNDFGFNHVCAVGRIGYPRNQKRQSG